MPPRTGRHAKLLRSIRDAVALSRSGALVINDGEAAIYFLWGQPSHAIFRDQDGEVEGIAALKAIALSLAAPRGRVAWKPEAIVHRETLLISGEDLITTLERLAVAPDRAPERLAGEDVAGYPRGTGDALEYDLADFPLLPAGAPLWADVPANVVHLDVLLQSLPTVLISFTGPDVRAACIVIHGQIVDGLYVDRQGNRTGASAARALLAAPEGRVSAFEIDEIMAESLPLLWRSRVAYRDMDLRWIEPHAFMEALRDDGEDRAVIIATPNAVGVSLIRHGLFAASYTTEVRHPQPSIALMLELFASGRPGSVTVLEGVVEDIDGDQPGVRSAIDGGAVAAARDSDQAAPLRTPPRPPEQPPAGSEAAERHVGLANPPDPSATAPAPGADFAPSWHWGSEQYADPQSIAVPSPPEPFYPADAEETIDEGAADDPGVGLSAGEPLDFAHSPVGDVPAADGSAEPGGSVGPMALFSFFNRDAAAPQASTSPPARPESSLEFEADFESVVEELEGIAIRFLGPEAAQVVVPIAGCEHSVPALRSVITTLRHLDIPGHSPDDVVEMTRAMLHAVADRLTAV